jgi:geranylgeranyl reductase family protein
MKSFDCIVVGAGPAGIAASKILEKNKINFCIIDKSSFPREKLCGGGLTIKSARMLKELGIKYDNIDNKYTNEVLVVSKNKNKIVKLDNPIVMVDRKTFDNNNLKQIKNKNIFLNEKIIDIKDNILSTDKNKYEFKYIIFADGVNGYSRKLIKNREFGFCVEFSSNKETDQTVLDFEVIKKGYGWIFPKEGITTIGLGNLFSKENDYIKALEDFSKKYNFEIDKSKIKGYHIPNFSKKVYDQSVIDNKYILVGDAAGLVDACSGEGIYYALASGKYAAESVIEALNNNLDLKETYFSKTTGLCHSLEKRKKLSKYLYSKSSPLLIKIGLNSKKCIKLINRVFG